MVYLILDFCGRKSEKGRCRDWKGLRLDRQFREEADNALALKAEKAARTRKNGPTRKSSGAIKQIAPVGVIGSFLARHTIRDPDAVEYFSDIYGEFRYFCDLWDYYHVTSKKFAEILTHRFRIENRRKGNKGAKARRGLRLTLKLRPSPERLASEGYERHRIEPMPAAEAPVANASIEVQPTAAQHTPWWLSSFPRDKAQAASVSPMALASPAATASIEAQPTAAQHAFMVAEPLPLAEAPARSERPSSSDKFARKIICDRSA